MSEMKSARHTDWNKHYESHFDVDRGVQVPFSSTRLVRIIAWWKYHKPLDLQFGLC